MLFGKLVTMTLKLVPHVDLSFRIRPTSKTFKVIIFFVFNIYIYIYIYYSYGKNNLKYLLSLFFMFDIIHVLGLEALFATPTPEHFLQVRLTDEMQENINFILTQVISY